MCADVSLVEYYPTIKELPEGERPRERLEFYGAGALSSAELLAIILRVGTQDENVIRLAQRLLTTYEGLPGLAQAPFSELLTVKGLGPAEARRSSRRLSSWGAVCWSPRGTERPPIVKSPADAANLSKGTLAGRAPATLHARSPIPPRVKPEPSQFFPLPVRDKARI